MMKYFFSFAITFFVTACQAQPDTNNSANYVVQGLAEAAANTPYMAKVQHVNVVEESAIDPVTQEEYQRHVYSADVLTTYRGANEAKISYAVRVEKGEDTALETTPVIIALCRDTLGLLYWPGTGSQFPVNRQTELWLQQHEKTLQQQNSTDSWCAD